MLWPSPLRDSFAIGTSPRIGQRLGLLATCLAAWFALRLGAAEPSRPNILFVFTDDHATQALGAYGSQLLDTPHLDRLAREGMRFDRCYVTNSICGPSRACILTGKYSHQNGFYRNGDKFDGSQTTFPKLLQRVGYQTAIIGKWHLDSDPTGFDHWQILPGQGRYYRPEFLAPAGRKAIDGYVTDVITDQALDWLKLKRDRQKPFLLMVQHKAPHREWSPRPDKAREFAARTFPEPATLRDDYANRSDGPKTAAMRIADDLVPPSDLKLYGPEDPFGKWLEKLMTPAQRAAWREVYGPIQRKFLEEQPQGEELFKLKYQRYLQDYLACVSSVDDNVGRLLDYLDEAGLAADTLVVYSSDQGFYLGEHGWFDKRFMYEESLRTPLLVRWPGQVEAGSVEERIVSNVDFASTLLDAAGVAPAEGMQGRSFLPLLQGDPPQDWRQNFYYHYYEGPPREHTVPEHYGVTDGRFKLIHYYKLDQWELFDLENDPEELRSVYGEPEYGAEKARLLTELGRLRSELKVDPDDPRQ